MINATINGINVQVAKGTTILDAARRINFKIPSLCKHPDLTSSGACGICIVKVKGSNKMLRSCCTPLEDGMDIITHDPEIVETRKTVLELILSDHPNTCLTCGRNQNCELQSLSAEFGVRTEYFDKIKKEKIAIDNSTETIVLEPEKCIKCGRCVKVCQKLQNVWALSFVNRGFETRIAPAADYKLAESPCVKCGQCSAHCPVGAIYEYDETPKVWQALQDDTKYCVVQIAPAVRVAIGERFGMDSGQIATKKLYSLLRMLGFKAVFDTNFGADLTIIEEGTEFVKRISTEGSSLPLITSCCPAWVDFMEKFHPDMIPNFSTCKSPHEMVAALSKTYYAEKMNIDPANMVMVSIMPCTAKKFEIHRSKEMYSTGYQDIDVSITTRELTRMIKQAGIDFEHLPESEADSLLGEYSGGGTIFGATGGVMEAALRSVNYLVTGENLENVEINKIRGIDGIKEAEVKVGEHNVKVAIAHGLANVEYVLNKIKHARENGEKPPYDFVEVMACYGGCIGGGGQPRNVDNAVRIKRSGGLYRDDRNSRYRNCHENPSIQKLYKEYLGEPGKGRSHELLHLTYKQREEYEGLRGFEVDY